MDLEDKVILITGASSGFGLASAKALAHAGAKVALAARTRDALDLAVSELRAAGADALAVPMDVTDDDSVERGVRSVEQHFGRVDVVINNAGNGGLLAYWADTPAAHTRTTFDVHVFGMERVSRAVLPGMRSRGAGAIVNIASTVGWVAMPGGAAYCAAKAAVLSFTEALAGELAGQGVTVSVFAPPHMSNESGQKWKLDAQVFSPEWAAAQLVKFLRKDRRRFLAGASNRMLLVLQRLSPSLAASIMRSMGLRALQRAQLPAH